MSLLKQKIIERIRLEGPINFETFMEMALYYPGLGYYAKDCTEIGRKGDFYTSPHLHPIFGAMIGRQMMEMWEIMGKTSIFHVVEIGAGMGYLARDMLYYLKDKHLFDHIRYTIIEMNPSLMLSQQRVLAEFMDKVDWITTLAELGSVTGCFLSNELLDAFPVRLIEMPEDSREGLKEIYVSVEDDEFVEVRMPCSPEVKEYLREFDIELPEGYRTEVNLRIREWLKEISTKLSEGFILTIDYGYPVQEYYSEDRNRGTLLCYYRHQVNEDPFRNIGYQDITAQLNFSALKKWGDELGLKTVGFCSQGTYLVSLGIHEVINEIYGDSIDAFEMAKIKGLILPQGMGESHKVMIQYKGKNDIKRLRGFDLRNRIDWL